MLKCSSAHTVSCLFIYHSFANTERADVMCSNTSSNFLDSLHLLSVSVVVFLSHDILLLMPDLVLPSFNFQFLLSDLPLTAIRMCLFR